VGDSRLYLLRTGRLVTRTRDHTPVEELLQSGVIEEDELITHPLRNSVNRCLGGALRPPKISLDHAELKPGDTLLLCSDGLWSALPEQKLLDMPTSGELEFAVNELTDEAEKASYPHSDNISLVGLRWLSAADPQTSDTGCRAGQRSTAAPAEEKAPLQQAIDDINRAILDYASEMKK
jgi:serine/threonine protein phosphatase PrpC